MPHEHPDHVEPAMLATYADWRHWPGDAAWKNYMVRTGRVLRIEPGTLDSEEEDQN